MRLVVVVTSRIYQQVAAERTHVADLRGRHRATCLRERAIRPLHLWMASELIKDDQGADGNPLLGTTRNAMPVRQPGQADQGGHVELATL